MPPKYIDRAYETVSNTPGTASAFSLNGAVEGFMTFAAAGAVDADTFDYAAFEGAKMEIGTGTYTATGTSLSRDTIHQSTNGGAAEDFTSDVKVFVTIRSVDLGGGGGLVPISKTTANAVGAVDIDLTGAYGAYLVQLRGVRAANASRIIQMQVFTDGGTTPDTGVADYSWGLTAFGAGATREGFDYDDSQIDLHYGLGGTATGDSFDADIVVIPGDGTNTYTTVRATSTIMNAGQPDISLVGGARLSTTAATDLRFITSSGNIASGTFHLYGIADGA